MLTILTGKRGRITAQAAVLATVVGAGIVYSQLDKSVTLSVDGRTQEVHSFSRTVAGLLDDQGLEVGPRDIVAPGLTSSLGEGQNVVVRYARQLTLTVDGEKRTYWTTETSVDRALLALGLRTDNAQLSASRSTRIDRAGLAMWMSTPKKVALVTAGRKRTVTSVAPTVAALLTEQKLTVGPLDKLSHEPTDALREGVTIKLVRIRKKEVRTTERIAFETTSSKNGKLYKGTTKVITKGRAGSRGVVYEVTLADGRETKRTLVRSSVLRRPVAQVQQVGTKSRPRVASGGGGTPGGSGLNWAALAQCESGGRVDAVNPAGYYGLYQFSLSTWRAQGGSGNPADASAAEQTRRAQILYGKTGKSSWPHCGSRLFS